MLELRAKREPCGGPSSAGSGGRIRSFRAGLVRPAGAWRDGAGLGDDPPGTIRRRTAYRREEIEPFTATLRGVSPGDR